MLKSKKGITLVALVVTIVVLLILAGVSINLVLGDNGIISKAQEGKTKSAEASENDLKGMNSLIDEMETVLNGGNTEETVPYLPSSDFHYDTSTSVDTGLVIADSNGNEYVWVVVPKSLYNNTNYNLNNEKKPSSSTDYVNIEHCLQQYTAIYRNGTSYSDIYAADTANVGWFEDETEYNNLKNSMLKSVYENGGFYVGRYEAGIDTIKGENRTSDTEKNSDGKYTIEGMPTPVTKADAYPYTWVTRTQAQNLANNVNSGSRTSSLMFGVQWDLVLAFLSKDTTKITSTDVLTKNSTTIGNYSDSAFQLRKTGKYALFSNYSLSSTWSLATTATEGYVDSGRNKLTQSSIANGTLVTTGTSEQSKVMNIYDVAGNVYEWTLEKASNTGLPCARRGGYFNNTGSVVHASIRNGFSTEGSNFNFGFRVEIF
ncbi:MAG: hypothetical protein KHW52_01880 [Clostridium sp.]|jgi:hypothetical protein|nr:hypothetical protein [Clostridium sp.]